MKKKLNDYFDTKINDLTKKFQTDIEEIETIKYNFVDEIVKKISELHTEFEEIEKEIISSHGNNKNPIYVWSYPKMNKITELTGHLSRALYMTMSPDGCTMVSGASDETLRFWNINERDIIKKKITEHNSDNFLSCFSSIMSVH